MSLNAKALASLAALTIVMGLLVFVSAGSLGYWQAWVYLVVYCGSSLIITLYLMKSDPALLKRRMAGGPMAEPEPTQKIIMLFASFGFIVSLVLPALDHRFAWSNVPVVLIVAGDLLIAICFYVIYLVFRENTFTSSTIELAQDQRVIETGPYAFVRHPMYAGGSLLFIGSPLALGSYWGLLAFIVVVPFLIWRLLHEERFLIENLPGYRDYCAKVRWRIAPRMF